MLIDDKGSFGIPMKNKEESWNFFRNKQTLIT